MSRGARRVVNCAYCGGRIHAEDRRCPQCGSTTFIEEELPTESAFAPNVASQPFAPNVASQPFVPNAAPQPVAPQVVYVQTPVAVPVQIAQGETRVSPKSRVAAAVWCVLFGWLGFHRFYVGKIVSGILYLMSFGGFGIGVLIDLFLLLFGRFRDRDGRLLA